MIRLGVPALCLTLLLATITGSDDATASPAPAAPSASAVRTVVLPTGDRVAVTQTATGQPSVTLAPGSDGPSRTFQVLASGTHLYVVPQVAAGYVGAPLDLSLFDVNALPTADATAPLELTASFTGTTAPALPGMTATGPTTLELRDPAALGRAMAADWSATKRDPQRDEHLFDGVTRLARPGTAAATAPAGKLYTLTVKAFDRLGRRANGDLGTVMNADNVDNFLAGQSYYRGEFAFSVPAGTYSITSYITTGHSDGSADVTLAADPEVTVVHDTTVTLDARKGVPFSASVSRPTTQVIGQLNVQRNGAVGVSLTDSLLAFGATPLYATPTAAVRTGQLYFYPGLRLGDADGSVQHAVYDMEFPYIGAIPSSLDHTISDNELATVTAHYHSAVPGRAEFESRQGYMPWQAVQVSAGTEVVAPVSRTEYVLAQPQMLWLQEVMLDGGDLFGAVSDGLRSYTPGERATTDWAAQPMAPGIEQWTQGVQDCPACRSGDTLNMELFGSADAAGHVMLPDPSATESLTLYQDGTQVGQSPSGYASFPLSPDPAGYRLVYDVARHADWWPSSTSTHTEWSFSSQERAPDQLPAGWTCGGKGGGGGGGRGASPAADASGCSFEPLLFARYTTGAGIDDVVPAGGPATVDVDIAHQLGASAAPITSFSAQISYDDGTTWQDVPASDVGDGNYRLSYAQPSLNDTDGFASLHITASDSAGSSIDQTITRAYPLSVPAAAPPAGDQPGAQQVRACDSATAAPFLQCMAVINAAAGASADQPKGYGPADIQSAYRIPAAARGGTVGIVDAYDDPNAEADLAAYREQYGLPPCTTANGCLRKLNQHGQPAPLPDPSPGWGLEISLDLDAVSATCPACKIVLIEADSSSYGDLLTGVLAANALGVDAISNSYGSRGEFSGEQTLERYYRDLTTPALFATGDYGYGNGAILVGGISYPAASRYVVAVGGTSLARDSSARGWNETAWDGATSGCSAYIHKPGWQKDELCDMRTVSDVSAVADPATGLAVYDTFGYDGWVQVGGTSLATPIVSSIFAMAGIAAKDDVTDLYRNPSAFFDAVGGSNGTNCAGSYLCNGVPGYDGPTGIGTPDVSAPFWNTSG